MRKGQESDYDKWNISVVICNTDIIKLTIKIKFEVNVKK